MPGYAPTEVLRAFRAEFPHRFDDVDDKDLLDAIKVEDPETYKLADPTLIGSELLDDSRKALPGAPAPAKPLPTYTPPPSTAERVLTTGLRLGGGLAGGAAGTLVGAPTLGAMGGMGAGEIAAETLEKALGSRTSMDPTEVGIQTAFGAYQPLEAGGGPILRTAIRAGEGALLGTAGDLVEQARTEPVGTPPQFRLAPAATGAVLGGGMHAAIDEVPRLAPDLGTGTGELPPAGPTNPSGHMLAAAQIAEAARATERGEIERAFAKRGWSVPANQRGTFSDLQDQRSYLDRLAELQEPPVAIPPIAAGAPAPAPPPQLALPSSPIIVEPPDYTPPYDPRTIEDVRGGPPNLSISQRRAAAQSTADQFGDQLESGLNAPPGPPRLRTQKQLSLTGEVPPATPSETPDLLAPADAETPPSRPQQRIQKGATPDQRYLPGTTQPRPLDRTYAEGPNAGPRREGEVHGEPRPVRRQVDNPSGRGYHYETAPSTRLASDPATWDPTLRREVARMAAELEMYRYERHAGGVGSAQIDALKAEGMTSSEAVAHLRSSGASSGGATAGAPVYHDIRELSEGGQNATRDDVLQALRSALLEGKGSALSDAAVEVAARRQQFESAEATEQGSGRRANWVRDAGTGKTRIRYRPLSAQGEGDALIHWTDEATGDVATPQQDLSPAEQDAREASDGELLSTYRNFQRHGVPDGLEPHMAAIESEVSRRGLVRSIQPPLDMEGPGGAKGPSLLDFEGEPPSKPSFGVAKADLPDYTGEAVAQSLQPPVQSGSAADVPQTSEGRQLERERLQAAGQPLPAWLAEDQPSLPGTEGVRDQSNPTPLVAEAPFALTPPPAPKRVGERTLTERPGLLQRLMEDEGVLVLNVPAGDRKGLQGWLKRQEDQHGDEAWFNRVEQAIDDGDWDRAWKTAASASVRSYSKALDTAETPEDEALLQRAVKGTPLQADIQTQIVGQARRKGLPPAARAPAVSDFPPSAKVSQAGAARGKATIGPAGIINPGVPQRPLAPKYTDAVLARTLQKSIIEASDPALLHTIPGNEDTNLRLYRQIADLGFRGANTKEVKQYLNLSDEEIGQHFLRSVQEAARTMQQLSAFAQLNRKTLTEAAEAMSMGGALEGMLGGPPPKIVGARGREIGRVGQVEGSRTLESLAEETRTFDQAMLLNTLQKPKANEFELLQAASYPFMISKWATAVRNAVTQAGRYGVEALDDALTIPLGTLLGDEESTALAKGMLQGRLEAPTRSDLYVPPTRAWHDTVQQIFDMTADTMDQLSPEDGRATLKVLTEFPTEAANFLGSVSTLGEDAAEGRSRFGLLNSMLDPKVQHLLTVFNRAQEFTGRGLVFDASMRAQLRAKGLDPNVVLQQSPADIAEAVGGATALDEVIHNSVASALEATFAARLAKNSVPAALVRFINSAWPLKLGYPFPRFNLASAPRFIWDHGPWALVDLMRLPIDVGLGAQGGGRLTRGIRAQQFMQRDIPELVGKRQASEGRLGAAVRDLVASKRELAVRTRMINRLQRKVDAGEANANLFGMGGQLDEAQQAARALSTRVDTAQRSIATEKGTVRDLRAQEEKLLDAVRDAHGIGAPTLPQYFARIGVGSALLGAAFVVRSQDGAQGTKWYEYRVDRGPGAEGKPRDPITLDFRPFAPFAQYLYVADVLQDFYHHTDWPATVKDAQAAGEANPLNWSRAMWSHYTGKYTGDQLGAQFAQAFLSMSRAAGTTLTITDLLTQNGMPSLQDAADSIVGTVGQFLSRFTVPLQQLRDLAGAVDPEEAKARIVPRATLDEPLRPLAAPLANIPYASQAIPDRISQTTGQPLSTEYPLLRGGAGIGTSPRDFVQEEAQRIGLPGQAVYIRETGDYGLDRMVAETYARILQQELPQVLSDPTYQALGTPADQRDYLSRWIFPNLKRAALADVRQGLGDQRFQAATVKGEGARRQQRQLDLVDRLQGEVGPAAPDDPAEADQPPPGPPTTGAAAPADLPPGRPF